MDNNKLPIVYSSNYDITFFKLEKLHVFDLCKWSRILSLLIEKSQNFVNKNRIYDVPREATEDELLVGHTPEYLESLKSKTTVSRLLEMPLLILSPMFVTNNKVLSRFRYQVKGTIMAANLALKYKWAINIGGGFHHASEECGGGFCVYADISIAIKTVKKQHPNFKFLIIDLDAHQGNGHETDFPPGNNVYIMDIYNLGIYPHDDKAKKNITVEVPIISWTDDAEYMEKLRENLKKCFELVETNPTEQKDSTILDKIISKPREQVDSRPLEYFHKDQEDSKRSGVVKYDLIVYNAGTDCLVGDPFGRLDITREGIIARDEAVFSAAKKWGVPIVMVTSNGYQLSNAEIIAASIQNLFDKKIIE